MSTIELTKILNFADGNIKVFIEYQTEPLAVYRDKSPLAIKYFGFASYDNSPNKYFYNCEGECHLIPIQKKEHCAG